MSLYMETEGNSFCLSCGKRLKRLKEENNITMNYHKVCWNNIINDIKNFEQIAYTKYNYEKRICGLTKQEIENGEPIIVHFD